MSSHIEAYVKKIGSLFRSGKPTAEEKALAEAAGINQNEDTPSSVEEQRLRGVYHFRLAEALEAVGEYALAFEECFQALAMSHPKALALRDRLLPRFGSAHEREVKLGLITRPWIHRAMAEKKDCPSPILYMAAMCLRQGYGCEKDPRGHMELMEMAMDKGLAAGCLGVGYGLDNQMAGPTYARDLNKIERCYKLGLELGNALCANNLGVLNSEEGLGHTQNHHLAMKYYMKAALMHDPQSEANMACNIIHHKFDEHHLYSQDAVVLSYRSAMSGSLTGLRRLGECYRKGLGVPVDNMEAAYWHYCGFRRGKELDDDYEVSVALHCLGEFDRMDEVPNNWRDLVRDRYEAEVENEKRVEKLRALALGISSLREEGEEQEEGGKEEKSSKEEEEEMDEQEKEEEDEEEKRREIERRAEKEYKVSSEKWSKVVADIPLVPHERTRVFVCYARKDHRSVKYIVNALRGEGMNVFTADDVIVPGAGFFEDQVVSILNEMDFIVMCVSPNAFTDHLCGRVIQAGVKAESTLSRKMLASVWLDHSLLHAYWNEGCHDDKVEHRPRTAEAQLLVFPYVVPVQWRAALLPNGVGQTYGGSKSRRKTEESEGGTSIVSIRSGIEAASGQAEREEWIRHVIDAVSRLVAYLKRGGKVETEEDKSEQEMKEEKGGGEEENGKDVSQPNRRFTLSDENLPHVVNYIHDSMNGGEMTKEQLQQCLSSLLSSPEHALAKQGI